MRSTPDRLAIRTKLLEVYAKRRDTKGFELLATQLFSLTRGDGDDWAKAQEMGRQIDPENPLYQPGGAPVTPAGAPAAVEPLSASTMPQSVLPSPSRFEATEAVDEPLPADASNVDLDLDLDIDALAAPAPSAPPAEPQRSFEPLSMNDDDLGAALDLPPLAPPAPAPAPVADAAMDFDLSEISLDLDAPAAASPAPAEPVVTTPDLDLGGMDLMPDDDGADPLARKLELAEEFRQIGDMEGARDLLQEVVAKADGALRSKAQGMLSSLG
jgi:pilus assembly protein FimV